LVALELQLEERVRKQLSEVHSFILLQVILFQLLFIFNFEMKEAQAGC